MCYHHDNLDSCHISNDCMTGSCQGKIGSNLTFGVGYDLNVCGGETKSDGSDASMTVQFQTPGYPCLGGLFCSTYCIGDGRLADGSLPAGITFAGSNAYDDPTSCVYEIKAEANKAVSLPIPGLLFLLRS